MFEAILAGIRVAVVVIDRQFRVVSWVEEMRKLWGLEAREAEGKSLFDLDIGLPVAKLRPALESCLGGEAQEPNVELDAVNRRGMPIRCAVTCRPMYLGDDVSGAIVIVQQIDGAEHRAQAQPLRGGDPLGNRAR
jgi:two-component system CheB/CheR fusion protein